MQGLRERLTVLERELGRLQRQNLQLRWLLLGVLLLSWLPYLLATQERTAAFHTVRAQRVEIVSPEGNTVMALSAVPLRGGDALGFLGKDGKCIAAFSAFPEGSLFIYKDKSPTVSLSSFSEGGSLDILNKDGELVVSIGVRPDTETGRRLGSVGGGYISIRDRYGNPMVDIVTSNLGGRLTLLNSLGTVTFSAP